MTSLLNQTLTLRLFYGIIFFMAFGNATACVYNETACTCSYNSNSDGTKTCLRLSDSDDSLCESYTCGGGYACDCSGSELCTISSCDKTIYVPTTTISSSGLTSCIESSVSYCTEVESDGSSDANEDSSDTSYVYNYTIVTSGDYTVYSSGSTVDQSSVRVPRRGEKSVTSECNALIIETDFTYSDDTDLEQGLSIAIQETDSDEVYVSGDSGLSILMAFNPSGDYKTDDSFDFSSWKSPATRPKLRSRDEFADASSEFGAEPIGFDNSTDSSVNRQNGIYVYYVELPFCERTGGPKKPAKSGNKPNIDLTPTPSISTTPSMNPSPTRRPLVPPIQSEICENFWFDFNIRPQNYSNLVELSKGCKPATATNNFNWIKVSAPFCVASCSDEQRTVFTHFLLQSNSAVGMEYSTCLTKVIKVAYPYDSIDDVPLCSNAALPSNNIVLLTVQPNVTNAANACGLSKIDFVAFMFANRQDGTTLEDAACADPVSPSPTPSLAMTALTTPSPSTSEMTSLNPSSTPTPSVSITAFTSPSPSTSEMTSLNPSTTPTPSVSMINTDIP